MPCSTNRARCRLDGLGEEGLYHVDGTRFLSIFELELEATVRFTLIRPSAVDNDHVTVMLYQPRHLVTSAGLSVPTATIHLCTETFLWRDALYQETTVTSYGPKGHPVADAGVSAPTSSDIFEVRVPHRLGSRPGSAGRRAARPRDARIPGPRRRPSGERICFRADAVVLTSSSSAVRYDLRLVAAGARRPST